MHNCLKGKCAHLANVSVYYHYICVCAFFSYSDTHVRMLEDCIQETILEQNKLAAGSDRSVEDGLKGKIT